MFGVIRRYHGATGRSVSSSWWSNGGDERQVSSLQLCVVVVIHVEYGRRTHLSRHMMHVGNQGKVMNKWYLLRLTWTCWKWLSSRDPPLWTNFRCCSFPPLFLAHPYTHYTYTHHTTPHHTTPHHNTPHHTNSQHTHDTRACALHSEQTSEERPHHASSRSRYQETRRTRHGRHFIRDLHDIGMESVAVVAAPTFTYLAHLHVPTYLSTYLPTCSFWLIDINKIPPSQTTDTDTDWTDQMKNTIICI